MPFTDHQGVRIYYEAEGEGPPIVLAHGFTGNTTLGLFHGWT
jgi:pimeloyl-ACP methyl ester carboxylesterase